MTMSRRLLTGALVAAAIAAPATAEPTFGCYERVYSDSHLAGQPDQVVRELRLYLTTGGGAWIGGMEVISANQGHAARDGMGGQQFSQFLICWEDGGQRGCSVECDGGGFVITGESADSLTFRTDYLMVGDIEECGGSLDLAEKVGQPVSYKLNRVADGHCAAISGM